MSINDILNHQAEAEDCTQVVMGEGLVESILQTNNVEHKSDDEALITKDTNQRSGFKTQLRALAMCKRIAEDMGGYAFFFYFHEEDAASL